MSPCAHVDTRPHLHRAEAGSAHAGGGGLRGDRYVHAENRRPPDYEITLIEAERIEAFVRETGLALGLEEPRRNLVTRCDPVSDGAA